jgi:hypothetical protein
VPGTIQSASSMVCICPPQESTGSVAMVVEVEISFNGLQFESGVSPGSRDRRALNLRYYTISTLAPSFGSANGGTVIAVNGTNLLPSGSCNFRFTAQRTLSSELGGSFSAIRCISPVVPSEYFGNRNDDAVDAEFTISMYSGQDSNMLTYRFTRPLTVLSIFPGIGPVEGNYAVQMIGTHILKSVGCKFGRGSESVLQKARWFSSSKASCVLPPFNSRDEHVFMDVRIALYNNPVQEEAFVIFEYFDMVSIQPCGGPTSGGTVIAVLLNRNLSNPLVLQNVSCLFRGIGQSPASIMPGFRSRLACISPAGKPQILLLNISLDGQLFSQKYLPFLIYTEPLISRIRANSGPLQGGTIVTVIGIGFLASGLRNDAALGQVMCRFGNRPQVSSYDWIISRITENKPSFWSETVAEPLGSGPALRWMCRSPPFEAIYFNVSKQNLTFSNYSVPISLTFDGQFYTGEDVFFNYFEIQSLQPSLGPINGQTAVRIIGPNMDESLNEGRDMACLWDGEILMQAYYLVEEGCAICSSPPKPSNLLSMSISLEIRLNNVRNPFSLDQKVFLYYRNPEVIRMAPSSAPRMGGFTLLISGLYFFQHENLRCRFNTSGTTVARYNYSLFAVECPIPRYTKGSPILFRVSVSLNAQQFDDFGNRDITNFQFYGLDNVNPVAAALGNLNLNLTLRGTNLKLFGSGMLPNCIISSFQTSKVSNATDPFIAIAQIVPAVDFDLNSQTVICSIPTFVLVPSVVFLDLDLGQKRITGGPNIITADRLTFTFYSENSQTMNINPSVGFARGGIIITVIGSGFMDTGALICTFHSSLARSPSNAFFVSSSVVICKTPSFTIPAYPSTAHAFNRSLGEYALVGVSLSLDDGRSSLIRGENSRFVFLATARLTSASSARIPANRIGDITIRAYGVALARSPYLGCRLKFLDPSIFELFNTTCIFEDNCGNVADAFIPSQISASSDYNTNGLTIAQRNMCVDLLVSIPSAWMPQTTFLSQSDFQVLFTLDGQDYSASSFSIGFYSVYSLFPTHGPSRSATVVTISGTNIGATMQRAACKFGTVIVSKALWHSDIDVICPVSGLSPGKYSVEVQVSEGVQNILTESPWSSSGLFFTSYIDPVIDWLEPSSGRNDFSYNITIFGANFAGRMLCRFQLNTSQSFVFDFVPNSAGVGVCIGVSGFSGVARTIMVELTRNGVHWSNGRNTSSSVMSTSFQFFGVPTLQDIFPSYGYII